MTPSAMISLLPATIKFHRQITQLIIKILRLVSDFLFVVGCESLFSVVVTSSSEYGASEVGTFNNIGLCINLTVDCE